MTLSKAAFSVGAVAVFLAVIAAITASPEVGVVAALIAVVAWYLQDRSSARQEAETRARAAKTEESLLILEYLVKSRSLDHKVFLETLKLIPAAGPVEIVFKPNDDEVYGLAMQVNRWLGLGENGDGAGWKVSTVRPMNDSDAIHPEPASMPLPLKSGAWHGVALMVRELPQPTAATMYIWPFIKPSDTDPPVLVLQLALQRAGVSVPQIWGIKSLSEGTIRIIIGTKPS
jgi:hypothetical protein